MNRVELEATIATRRNIRRALVVDVLQEFQDIVLENMRGGRETKIVGFGSFQSRRQKPRRGKNPKTGEPIDIPASTKPAFRPSRSLIEALNLPPDSDPARSGPGCSPAELKRLLDERASKREERARIARRRPAAEPAPAKAAKNKKASTTAGKKKAAAKVRAARTSKAKAKPGARTRLSRPRVS